MIASDFDLWLRDPARPLLIMGVLNVTPDSFSDGGCFAEADAAVAHAQAMCAAGADLIDIGGESTRPGSGRVPAQEQLRRVLPVLSRLRGLPAVISIDTTLAAVAAAAADHGAALVNDISAGREDPRMFPLAATRNLPLVLMHMQGVPATMQAAPVYADVVAEVQSFFEERILAAAQAGVGPHRLILDPGIGFGKSLEHNLELLRQLPRLGRLGLPLLLGTSRKSFLGALTGKTDPRDRLMATAASVAWCAANGASIVRVHDVEAMADVVKVIRALAR